MTDPDNAKPESASRPSRVEQRLERFDPRVLMPPMTGARHVLSIVLGSGLIIGLVWVVARHLPTSLPLLLVIAPAAGWVWLSARALRANGSLPERLLGHGQVVRGTVLDVDTGDDDSPAAIRYRYHVVPPDVQAIEDEAVWSRYAHEKSSSPIDAWSIHRYSQGMTVAVVLDPEAPDDATLLPPPGGGRPFDLLGDVFAWALRRVPTESKNGADETPDEPTGQTHADDLTGDGQQR